MKQITAVILAAGAGTRMKSKLPKVLHKVCGKMMVEHVIDATEEVQAYKTIVVTGHSAEQVERALEHRNIKFVLQRKQLGTGHAVMQCVDDLPDEGYILLLCGDTPLITSETLKELVQFHIKGNYQTTVLTAKFQDPTGYGRIIRDEQESVLKIVEDKDANEDEKDIKEINSGMYCCDAKLLKEALLELNNNNKQGEYYITDIVEILNRKGYCIGAYTVSDQTEIMGVNSRIQLADAEAVMRKRILKKWMAAGVTIVDPLNTYIDKDVKIGQDTVIDPGVILKGNTNIGQNCIIGHNCRIKDTEIKAGVEIQSSTLIESFVDENCHVGPYAYLRPGSRLGKNVKIGDFVEVKKSSIGDGSKASHLSYIGDAEVGKNVNIGCGVVFVNYDGKNKYKTIVEDNAFIGSNSNLVAPVIVRKYGYIATGSTITKEVSEGALSVARERQRNIEGWVERKGLLKKGE